MKDINITITTKRQRTELLIFCVCFVLAFLANIISIIVFETEWSELFTQLLWVLAIGVLLYCITLFFRLIYWGIRCAIGHKKQ